VSLIVDGRGSEGGGSSGLVDWVKGEESEET